MADISDPRIQQIMAQLNPEAAAENEKQQKEVVQETGPKPPLTVEEFMKVEKLVGNENHWHCNVFILHLYCTLTPDTIYVCIQPKHNYYYQYIEYTKQYFSIQFVTTQKTFGSIACCLGTSLFKYKTS